MTRRSGSHLMTWVIVILAVLMLVPLLGMIAMMAMGGTMMGGQMGGSGMGGMMSMSGVGAALDGSPGRRADRLDRLSGPHHQPKIRRRDGER